MQSKNSDRGSDGQNVFSLFLGWRLESAKRVNLSQGHTGPAGAEGFLSKFVQ
jgi:hypothetical protein